MADLNLLQPQGHYRRKTDLGSNQYAESVADVTKRAGEDVTNDIQRAGRYLATLTASYTRPNDTTAYASGDVVAESTSAATILTFAAAVRAAGATGRVVGARIQCGTAAGTKGDFELYLFSSSITMQQDNAAWAPSDAEMRNCLGVIAFGNAPKVGSGNEIYHVSEGDTGKGLPLNFTAGAGLTDIYGVLVVRSAYTPGAQDVIQVQLVIQQD